MAGGPIFPNSIYHTDTTGRTFPNFYNGAGGGSPNIAPVDEGIGVKASLDADAVVQLRFAIPPTVPSGTLKLRALHLANAITGAIYYTVSDANVAAGASPSAATLTAETQSSYTFAAGAADKYHEIKTTLTASPSGNDMLVVAVKYQTASWGLAANLTSIFSIIWE